MTTHLREELRLSSELEQPQEISVGYMITRTDPKSDKWLIEGLIRQGSINLWSFNNGNVGGILRSIVQRCVIEGEPFCGHNARQGGLLSYPGRETIWTDGPVKCEPRRCIEDPTYLPLSLPIQPHCGFVKDLVKSGVKLIEWSSFLDAADWIGRQDEVNNFDYLTKTEAAAIISADVYVDSIDLAIRSFRRGDWERRMLSGHWLRLQFVPGKHECTLRLSPIEDFSERVQAASPAEPCPEYHGADRIYWGEMATERCKIFCHPTVLIDQKEEGSPYVH